MHEIDKFNPFPALYRCVMIFFVGFCGGPQIKFPGGLICGADSTVYNKYFDEISAPYKKLYMMENITHGLLESKSEAFSEILHEIVKEQN